METVAEEMILATLHHDVPSLTPPTTNTHFLRQCTRVLSALTVLPKPREYNQISLHNVDVVFLKSKLDYLILNRSVCLSNISPRDFS